MIRAVLFDFGGVLSEAGGRGTVRNWLGKVYGLDLDLQKAEDVFYKMWRGQITNDVFLAEMSKRFPDTPVVTKADFLQQMEDLYRCEPVYSLAGSLRRHGITTGILSNVFGMGAAHLKAGGFYDDFDPVLLSSDTGLAKPDVAFYELALTKLGRKPEEVLFIDDQQYALDPAIAIGMHTVLAVSPQQIVDDTKAIIKAQNNLDL
ncbi:MAG TPA: HAD family phosphatase [Candidatus Saccharimonadales bacterium]|nr:HAD family phosphatase [Candidatus Saccharimonadales bacterium]